MQLLKHLKHFSNFATRVTAVVAVATLAAVPASAQVFVDFDDLPMGGPIVSGSSFASGGVTIDVTGVGSGVTIMAPSPGFFGTSIEPTDPNVAYPNNVFMTFDLTSLPGGGATAVGFDSFDQGGTVDLSINGVATGQFNTYVDLHGTSLGAFDITGNQDLSSTSGFLTETFVSGGGLITSFGVWGQETQYDDFRFRLVPEPASLGLLAVGGLALVRRR
ncbi:MAG: PEP-CTERM sorting domain-containing protein [Planctomycetota bacterium]